eukprot:gene646-939_t
MSISLLITILTLVSVESIFISPASEEDGSATRSQRQRSQLAVEPSSLLRTGPSTATDYSTVVKGKTSITKGCKGYIIQLTDSPVVQWAAAQQGTYAAAAGGSGGRVSSLEALRSAAARQHAAFLQAQSSAVANRALGGTARISVYYTHAYAGFYATCLQSAEVAALRRDPGVANVTPNRAEKLAPNASPNASWVWMALVVFGVIDSGYWPEHPSFSDQVNPNNNTGGAAYGAPPVHFKGTCNPGNESASVMCNLKVLSCNHFLNGTEGGGGTLEQQFPGESFNC